MDENLKRKKTREVLAKLRKQGMDGGESVKAGKVDDIFSGLTERYGLDIPEREPEEEQLLSLKRRKLIRHESN